MVAPESSAHSPRFLKIAKVNLDAVALQGFGVGFVEAVEGGEAFGQRPAECGWRDDLRME